MRDPVDAIAPKGGLVCRARRPWLPWGTAGALGLGGSEGALFANLDLTRESLPAILHDFHSDGVFMAPQLVQISRPVGVPLSSMFLSGINSHGYISH